jgi:peptidoglycan/xylan/chitin deacetylase (PgdA/CDA1 family)
MSVTRREVLAAAGALSLSAALPASARSTTPAPKNPSQNNSWPDGARLVISLSMQFEAGAQPARGASAPFPPLDTKYPDLPVDTWYDYGVREGIPRLLALFARRRVVVTSHMVGQAVDKNPALAKEIVTRGHEAAAHGQTWTPQFSMSPNEERAAYSANIASIERATGTRPVGFNAFWMRGTPATLSILQSLGFTYHIDDLSRDEPYVIRVNDAPFAVVPYTVRNNDIVRYDNSALTPAAFATELKDEFDVLYEEAATRRRMMSVSVHDRIGGTPARVKALADFIAYAQKQPGVVFMRKDHIAQWILQSGARTGDAAQPRAAR